MKIKTICICGGGGQCHAIAPFYAQKGYKVNILTGRPDKWATQFSYTTPDGYVSMVTLGNISNNPAEVISEADVIFVTVPGYMIRSELERMKPYLKNDAYVGGVFASNGFFFEALEVLPNQPLFGFQRVPFIGKIEIYGQKGAIRGFKTQFVIAVENAHGNEFATWLSEDFEVDVDLRKSYLEVSISNSNPILHTARLYSLLHNWDGTPFPCNFEFYSQWTDSASYIYRT